jgi:hypothetical protein
MKRYSVLLMVLATCLSVVAQTGTAPAPIPGYNPAYGYINTGGYVTSGPAYGWSLYAPIVHLGTPPAAVGATNATLGNMAGATNSTLEVVPVTTPAGPVVEVMNPVPTTMPGQPGTAAVAPGTTAAAGAPAPLNLGVGPAPGLVAMTSGIDGPNLGEIARTYRQKDATARVRTYTNDDIQRINQQSGGTAGTAINAGTSTTTSPGQPAGTTNPAANPANPSTMTPENTPRTTPQTQPAQPQRTPPPPLGASQSSSPPQDATLMAQAMPPENASQSGGNQAPAAGQLPRTGSLLPIVAVVGLLAAAAGLVARYR